MTVPTTHRELARENTGAHFLDSGSAYGRQHDRPIPPEDHPLQYAHAWGKGQDADLLISLPVMLDEEAPIDARETRKFRLWAHLADPRDDRSWANLAAEYIRRRSSREDKGWENEGTEPVEGNSYNEDTELDQDFYWIAPDFYTQYAIVRTHNGCDARGGYSTPVVVNTGEGIAGALCAMRLDFYCRECQDGTEGSYEAEEQGWRGRVNKRSVALVCPTCRKVAFHLPIQGEHRS